MEQLDLSLVRENLHELMRDAIRRGHVGLVFNNIDINDALKFACTNARILNEHGILEGVLARAYTDVDRNHSRMDGEEIANVFRLCDRARLRELSDVQLPSNGITVFRGVSGEKASRRVNGLSWTLSLDRACWFATWQNLPDPAVYRATVRHEQVYFATDKRHEQEIVCDVTDCKRLDMSHEVIKAKAERVRAETQRQNAEEFGSPVQ